MTGTGPSGSPCPADTDGKRAEPPETRRAVLLGAALVILTFGLLVEARLWRPDARFTIIENVQIGEAEAWWNGRLDLPERKWDTALIDGRVYSHFPPMFSFIAAGVLALCQGVPHWFIVVALVLPVLLLSYHLLRKRTGSALWGSVLAIGFVCGTSALPVIDKTLRGANPFHVNQTLATIGLLILLVEVFGRRRLWLAGIGLIVAALSRQMTVAYIIPLLWLAWQDSKRRRLSLMTVGAVAAIAVAVPCTLNALKFGHPLDTGYMYVYEDRPEDQLSRDARAYGLFSAHYVWRNLYYANLGFPDRHVIEMAGETEVHYRPNRMGTGIWWTSPLLIWLFVDIRRIWAEPVNRWLLMGVLVALTGLMFYHSTGWAQRGFNRYSLDYLPVLLTLIAPRCMRGWRRWVSLAAIAWSVFYFRFVI